MNKRLPIIALFSGLFLLYSFSSGPPTGRTGAPGEGLCTGCHSGSGTGLNGNVVVTGLPGTIIGGNTYTITVTVSNPNGVSQGAGFQMTALDENNLKAGVLSKASGGSKIHSGGGREYHDHTARKAYSGTTASWSVDWTAPSPPTDLDITLWAAGNITDSNPGFNSSGDLIVTTNASGTIMGSGPSLQVDIASSTNVSCFGGNDGTATAIATGGAGGYSYSWSNGQTGPVATNLSQGTYTVTATDSNGDMSMAQVNIQQPAGPTTIALIQQDDVSCFDGNDGSIQVQATGNNGGYTYQWSNGQNGPVIGGLKANTYTVTATDTKGCQESLAVEVTEPEELEFQLSTMDANCVIDSSGFALIRPEGGTPPYSYLWSNGHTNTGSTSEQNSLLPGDYSVEINDANDCELELMFTIEQDSGFLINLVSIDTPLCHNGGDGAIEVEISGGTAPFDIEWSNGDTTLLNEDLTAGTYIVYVKDDMGCMDSLTVDVPQRAPNIIEVLDPTTVQCPDDSLTINFTYSGGGWNGPSGDTLSITGGVDTHFYMLTDPNGCMQTDTIIIVHGDTIPPLISCLPDTTTGSCTFSYTMPEIDDNCDSIIYRVLTGPGPGEIFPAGITQVSIEAVDLAGNADTCSFEVNILNDLKLESLLLEEALCAGDTAMYRLKGSGGSGTLSIELNGDTISLTGDSAIIGLTNETTITLMDTTGCFDQISIGPNLVPLVTDSVVVTQMSRSGSNDGRLEVFVSGGTPGYSYDWKNESGNTVGDSSVIDSLSPGDYHCIIADNNLCSIRSDTFTIELITSTKVIDEEKLNVYPNPFNQILQITSNQSKIKDVKIFNNRGESVGAIESYNKNISYDLSGYSSGIYFLLVQTENGIYTRKVMKL